MAAGRPSFRKPAFPPCGRCASALGPERDGLDGLGPTSPGAGAMCVQTGSGVRWAVAAGRARPGGDFAALRGPGWRRAESLGNGVRGDCVPAASTLPCIRVPLGQALWGRAWLEALRSPSVVASLPLIPGCDLGVVGSVLKPTAAFIPGGACLRVKVLVHGRKTE